MSEPRRPDAPHEAPPEVPGFRTWRGVYALVIVVFILTVAALAVFSRVFA